VDAEERCGLTERERDGSIGGVTGVVHRLRWARFRAKTGNKAARDIWKEAPFGRRKVLADVLGCSTGR